MGLLGFAFFAVLLALRIDSRGGRALSGGLARVRRLARMVGRRSPPRPRHVASDHRAARTAAVGRLVVHRQGRLPRDLLEAWREVELEDPAASRALERM